MPPPGGPLIGIGMKAMLVEAAAAADMEHRHFINYRDGRFVRTITSGGGEYIDAWTVTVRDGSVEIDQIADFGSTSTADAPKPADYAYLQAAVFDYWRTAIDEVFVGWEDMPESAPLGYDLSSVLRGAAEIQFAARSDDSDGYQDGNSRLASDIDNLFARTGDLAGTYAYTFNTQYASRIRPNVNALHAMTMVLAYALGGEEELIQRTRVQVAETASKALDAFEASGPRGGSDATGLVVALYVVGAVAAGVAAVGSGGTSIPITAAVASGLTAAGASGAGSILGTLATSPDEPEKLPLGADHPDGVLTKLREALQDVNTKIRAEENLLDDLLSTAFEESKGVGSFQIDRPDILDHSGTDVLQQQQNVNVNYQVIADITHTWIPTITHELRTCAGRLTVGGDSWVRPESIGIGVKGPFPAYASLQFQISVLLHDTARELDGAAEALEEAARLIGMSDDDANATALKIATRVNAENDNS